MFAMAVSDEGRARMGHHISILVSSVAVALYVGLGGLRSAIFNEVLQVCAHLGVARSLFPSSAWYSRWVNG